METTERVDLLADRPELIMTPKLTGLFAMVGTPAILAGVDSRGAGGASARGRR